MNINNNLKFGHEFRFTFSIIGLSFMFSGLIDALVEDFTLKFFLITGIWVLLWWVSLYEMIYYPTPKHPLLESLLLLIGFISGTFGIHSMVWYIVSIMLGRKIESHIWLAPNIYIEKTLFIETAIALTILYIAILASINVLTTEKRE